MDKSALEAESASLYITQQSALEAWSLPVSLLLSMNKSAPEAGESASVYFTQHG